jgi:L-ascorbate metabolism protein UlaG (beta-lactamase superfamily)
MRTNPFLILIPALILQSCITFHQSPLSADPEENIEIGSCSISFTGPVYMNWFGVYKSDFMPFSMKIEFDTLIVFVDPVYVDDTEKADLIFITHRHIDHCNTPDIQKLVKEGTQIMGPEPIARKLKDYKINTVLVDDQVKLGRIEYEVVEAYNTRSGIHKKGSSSVGYVISMDSVRVYIAGDTDLIPEMRELKDIDLAVLPIGVGKTAMDPASAAKAAKLIRPKLVVPVHYILGSEATDQFIRHMNTEIEVRLLCAEAD